MKITKRLFTLAFAALSCTAFAQTFPSKPVRILVGYGPGGASDVAVRVVAEELTKLLGQPVVVENRAGANGLVAANVVKNAAPDGYTLYGGSVLNFASTFLKDNPLDAPKELQPVSQIAQGDNFIFARADLGISSLKELAEKSKTTTIRFSSPSQTQFLVTSLLAKRGGIAFDNIPYKTTDQVVISLLSGDGDFTANSLPGMPPHIESGKVRVLAALGGSRSSLLPNVPTAREQGIDLNYSFHLSLWAPLSTPTPVVAKLNAAVAEAVKVPNVAEKLRGLAMVPKWASPEDVLRAHSDSIKIFVEASHITGFKPQ